MHCPIDIIIPTKNRPEYVSKAIRSSLEQTTPPGKIIVVDDGSQPAIESVLDNRLSEKCTFIRSESSLGVSASRNRGASASSAEWLLFLDDDDWLSPTFVEKLKDHLESTAPALGFCWPSRTLVQEGNDKREQILAPEWNNRLELEPNDLSSMMDTGCSGTAIKSEALTGIGGFDESLIASEDRDVSFRILNANYTGTPVRNAMIFIRIHDGVRLSNDLTNAKNAESDMRVIRKNSQFLKSQPVLAEKFVGRVAKRLWSRGSKHQAIEAIDLLCKIQPWSIRHRRRQILWRLTLLFRNKLN